MFAFVEGLVEYIDEDLCVIDAGGFGINVFISARTALSLPDIGEHVKLYTYTAVREDAITLYGFDNRDDLSIFKKLISVSGVGPKGALGILSYFDSDQLRLAIASDDAKAISKANGIGLKTAQKIVLELKDKLKVSDDELIRGIVAGKKDSYVPAKDVSISDDMRDAIEALSALGFSVSDSRKAVLSIDGVENMESGEIMSLALKKLY